MAYSAILIVSLFLLLAFAVDRVSAQLRMPSVIVLLFFAVMNLGGTVGGLLGGGVLSLLLSAVCSVGLVLALMRVDGHIRSELADLLASQAWLTALLALAVIYGGRRLLLALARQEAAEVLLWFAPRGLITVLLFLTVQALSQADAPGPIAVPSLPAYFTGAVLIVVLVSTALVAMARRRVGTTGASTLNSLS